MNIPHRNAICGLLALCALACTAFTSDARPLSTSSPPSIAEAQLWPPVWFWDTHTRAVGLWRFENSAALGTDSSGFGNDLTNNNSVTQTTGQVGQAAHFVAASSQSLSIASNPRLQIRGPMTILGWIFLGASSNFPLGKWPGGVQNSWLIGYNNNAGSKFECDFSGTGSNNTFVVASATSTLNAWHFVVCQYDGTQITVQVDNGTIASTAYSGGVWPGTGAVTLGGSAVLGYINGNLDEVGLWPRALRAEEISYFWNGGSGRGLAFNPQRVLLTLIVERLKRAA